MKDTTICPTCGAACRVVGRMTKHYEPITDDMALRRVAEQLHMRWGDECAKSVLRPVDFRRFLGDPAWRELEALLDEQAVRDAEAALGHEKLKEGE